VLSIVNILYELAGSENEETGLVRQSLEKLLWMIVKRLDPSLKLVRELSRPLAIDYEKGLISASKLQLYLRVMSVSALPINSDYVRKSDANQSRYAVVFLFVWQLGDSRG
jgi:hypothetical protein